MVKTSFSHYAPRPLQQPQMPDMKQVNNHIRHFSLLSYLPSAGNPSTQPPIRRLALPLIRSITQPNARAHASLYQPTSQSPSFHQPRHTLHFSILSILLILFPLLHVLHVLHITAACRGFAIRANHASERESRAKHHSSSLSAYFVYFVV